MDSKAPSAQPDKFKAWVKDQFDKLSRGRRAEEDEWYESALFHQMRQWLDKDPTTGRMTVKKQDKDNPKPRPVSNYYSVTIDANANALGAAIPEMAALSNNYDAKNRAAADAAERAIDEANRESEFEFLNPTLAQRIPLFGLGVVKDWVEFKDGAETVPTIDAQTVQVGLACPVCGYTEPTQPPSQGASPSANQSQLGEAPSAGSLAAGNGASGSAPSGSPLQGGNAGAGFAGQRSPDSLNSSGSGVSTASGAAAGMPMQNVPVSGAPMQGGMPGNGSTQPCPNCGSPLQPVTQEEEQPGEGVQVPSAKLKSSLPLPFQVYVPRDCTDANLAKVVIAWDRLPSQEWERIYPDIGAVEGGGVSLNSYYYVNSLRRLNSGADNPSDDDKELVTSLECWAQWDKLPKDVQEELSGLLQGPSAVYPEMDRLSAAVAYGVMIVVVGDTAAEVKENYLQGFYSPYTFFPWQKDVASPYPKGLAVALKPLQKQLNRIDSLTETALMKGSAGHWLVPISQQQRFKISGDPSDVHFYDDDPEKGKPEYTQPSPYHQSLIARRQTLVQEFRELGYTSSLDSGTIPNGAPFRALAYQGAKQEESRKTQRFLLEQAHERRAKLQLVLARMAWDEPRKVKVSGFNGQFGMMELEQADLEGEYEIEVVQDSSRPKNVDEKIAALTTLFEGGVIDPQDPSVKDFMVTTLGMQDLNTTDELQFEKAQRDLEMLKQGIQPLENPFIKWDIHLKMFADYIQTEEFEGLQQEVRAGILMYTQYMSDKLTAATQGPEALAPPNAQQRAQAMAKGLQGPTPGQVLHGVPGQTANLQRVQGAAEKEAGSVSANMPDSAPTTT